MSIESWKYAIKTDKQRGTRVITIHPDGSFEHSCSRLTDNEGDNINNNDLDHQK
jgi:hypothetical protein